MSLAATDIAPLSPFTDMKVLRVIDGNAPGYRGALVMALDGRIAIAQIPLAVGEPATDRAARAFDLVVEDLLDRLRRLTEAQRVRWFERVNATEDPYLMADEVATTVPSTG